MKDQRLMLNEHGEILVITSSKYKSGEPISGRHEFCSGSIEAKRVSEKYSVLFCNSCNLRIAIPVGITNPRLLKKYLDGFKFESIAA
jgi:hypothetical protein